jgi:hypothetical protein
MMQRTYVLRRLCFALGVGAKEKYGNSYEFFKFMQQQELYHYENIFFFPTSIFVRKHWTEIFLFFLIMYISIVPNSFKSLAFGTVLHKNVIALADVFPISCQWKDISVWHPYFQYILIRGTHKMPYSSFLLNHQHLHLIPIKVMGLCVTFCAS